MGLWGDDTEPVAPSETDYDRFKREHPYLLCAEGILLALEMNGLLRVREDRREKAGVVIEKELRKFGFVLPEGR